MPYPFDHKGILQHFLVSFQKQTVKEPRPVLWSVRPSVKGAGEISWPRLVYGTRHHRHTGLKITAGEGDQRAPLDRLSHWFTTIRGRSFLLIAFQLQSAHVLCFRCCIVFLVETVSGWKRRLTRSPLQQGSPLSITQELLALQQLQEKSRGHWNKPFPITCHHCPGASLGLEQCEMDARNPLYDDTSQPAVPFPLHHRGRAEGLCCRLPKFFPEVSSPFPNSVLHE